MPQRAVTPKGRITGRLLLPSTGTYMVMWTATALHLLRIGGGVKCGRPLETKEIEKKYICTLMAHYDWTRLSLAQRKSGSAPQYNGTLAWSHKGNRMADYRMKHEDKKDKVKTKNKTHRIAVPLYSFMGSISRPFSSTFFSRSKVDRTDAAASVRVEWARCLPAQTLPGSWY